MTSWLPSNWPQGWLDGVYRVGMWVSISAGLVTGITGLITALVAQERERRSELADVARDRTVASLTSDLSRVDFQRQELEKDLAAEREQAALRTAIADQRERERADTERVLKAELEEAKAQATTAQERARESERHIANATAGKRGREIDADQRAKFVSLVGTDAKGPVAVSFMMSDPESALFASDLVGLLREGGWSVEDARPAVVVKFGVLLRVRAAENPPSQGVLLQSALGSIGVETVGELVPEMDPGRIQLLVGHRMPERATDAKP